MPRRRPWLLTAALLAAAMLLHSADQRPATAQVAGERVSATTQRLAAVPYGRTPPSITMATTERRALQERYLARRERQAAALGRPIPTAATAVRSAAGPAARLAGQSEAAGDLVTVRNNRNTIAQTDSSATAEPAAASRGLEVLYTGNWYASFSTDGGASWSRITIPAGPADAPFLCCDMDVIYDPGRDVFFWSVLYINDTATNGVVRIFVQPSVSGPYSCFFDVDPGGANLGVLPDYPHLGLSNNNLYLSTNNDSEWQVWRMPTLDLTACGSVASQVISVAHATYGHRVVVPVRGATGQMYWGLLDDSSTFRIYTWPEASSTATSTTRAISASAFYNPSCTGGTGNYDFIERETAWMINGFRLRGAVGAGRLTFMWNSAPVSGIPWAHIRAATFDEATLDLVAEPHLYLEDRCTGYPQVATSAAGNLAVTGAMGGGSSATAAQGFVTVDDDLTAGTTYAPLLTVAAATNNQASGRYGDYTTIQPQGGCANLWAATAYGLEGGDAAANVNARYVLFGRERDNCDLLPATPANFRATTVTSSSATLVWDDVSGETSYRFGRYVDGGVTQFFTAATNATSITDSGLAPGLQYYYWIQACAAGCSAWSPSITVQTPPPLPANFRLSSTSTSAIDVAWDDGAGETAYQIAWVTSTAPSAFTFQNMGADGTSWSHTAVTAGATYYYWMRACATSACSSWTGALIATAAVTPAVPTGLRALAASSTQIDIVWDDVSGEQEYQIAWTASSPISYQFQSLGANTIVWSHAGVAAGATYYYHVRGCAGQNCSAWSGGIAVTAAPPPPIPANFRVTASTSTAISLAWDDVNGETSYQVAYTPTSPISYQFVGVGANVTTTTINGLTPATTYYLHIRSCTGATCSNYHAGIVGSTAGARPDGGAVIPSPPSAGRPAPRGEPAAAGVPPMRAGSREALAPSPPPDDAPPPPWQPRRTSAPSVPPPAGTRGASPMQQR